MEQLGQFILNHWTVSVIFTVILLFILINEFFMQARKAKELSPQSAVDKINNEAAVIIDLRDKESFKTGHIINSMLATIDDFNQPKMNKYKKKPLILVCARGLQSSSAATKLLAQGFQPQVLAGGIAAWQAADFPLIKGKQ